MKREFLKNFQVNGQPLPDAVIEAIMAESTRDLEIAKGNPVTGGETAASASPEDEREQALKAREARLDCRDWLHSKNYPAALLDVLDSSDLEKFKTAVGKLADEFPAVTRPAEIPPPYAFGTGVGPMPDRDRLAGAFKPQI